MRTRVQYKLNMLRHSPRKPALPLHCLSCSSHTRPFTPSLSWHCTASPQLWQISCPITPLFVPCPCGQYRNPKPITQYKSWALLVDCALSSTLHLRLQHISGYLRCSQGLLQLLTSSFAALSPSTRQACQRLNILVNNINILSTTSGKTFHPSGVHET